MARMPLSRWLSRAHASLYRATGGRFLPRWFGAPLMVIEVAGRRSGVPRRNPVVYARDGEDFVVVAANAGADRVPSWFLNLQEAGAATLLLDGRRIAVAAQVTQGAERERLWRVFAKVYPPVEGYQQFTDRELPVIRLMPRS